MQGVIITLMLTTCCKKLYLAKVILIFVENSCLGFTHDKFAKASNYLEASQKKYTNMNNNQAINFFLKPNNAMHSLP